MSDRHRLLELALKGLEAERVKIDNEIAEIKGQINGRAVVARNAEAGNEAAVQTTKRRRMSAAARKKISEGMKRRYAALRAAMKK